METLEKLAEKKQLGKTALELEKYLRTHPDDKPKKHMLWSIEKGIEAVSTEARKQFKQTYAASSAKKTIADSLHVNEHPTFIV
jgi:hypothetical protein